MYAHFFLLKGNGCKASDKLGALDLKKKKKKLGALIIRVQRDPKKNQNYTRILGNLKGTRERDQVSGLHLPPDRSSGAGLWRHHRGHTTWGAAQGNLAPEAEQRRSGSLTTLGSNAKMGHTVNRRRRGAPERDHRRGFRRPSSPSHHHGRQRTQGKKTATTRKH
jgi:hypothetical protein